MRKTVFLSLLFWFLANSLMAQDKAPDSTKPRAGDPVVQARLGESVAALTGPWRFHIGDSPIDPATHRPLWADPDFDDSGWETVDLTPVPDKSVASSPEPRRVKGWTARGHAGYSGWAWYRLRVRVNSKPGEQMDLDGPGAADDAYQLFANGQLLGSFGTFDSLGGVQRISFDQRLMFSLPVAQDAENGTVTETLAFRFWMSPASLAYASSGGLRDAPLLVAGTSAEAQSLLDRGSMLLGRADEFAYIVLYLLLASMAASLMLFDRSDRVYLWIAATLLISTIGYVVFEVSYFTNWLDGREAEVLSGIGDPLQLGGWLMVWWVWFRLRRPAWVPKAIALLTVVYLAANTLKLGLAAYGIVLPYGHNGALLGTLTATILALRLSLVLAFVLVVAAGIRKEGKEGWFVLLAVGAMIVELFARDVGVTFLGRFHGINVQIWDLTDPFLVVVLVCLMLRRLLRSLNRQRQMALDVKQAQEVQQVILPEAHSSFPGLEIESEYRPAREVGGDFFQIIPDETDGSVLIIAGDVTGKGLKAGMLVALLVGAIRSTVEMTTEPIGILQALNRRLLGRSDAQATCIALRIEKDGSATLANAGHMAPYLNGEPMAMEGALPLGMVDGAEFSVMHFKLNERDRLMLMSDGIAEATDANGRLFGFERVHDLLRASCSASDVATAAQKFGQEDDISVIAVTCTAKLTPTLV